MVVKVPHIPAPGETILGSGFMTVPGGKGANQAVAAARAGADVTFIACVADDALGIKAVENYRKEGINISCIKVLSGTHSGIALINVAAGGENSISVAPGANRYLLPQDIGRYQSAFEGAAMVLAQLEIPVETVSAAAEVACAKGIPFILNPAPGGVIPEALFKKITIITPNETEAAIVTSKNIISTDEIPRMAAALYRRGIKTVIITLGSKGVYLKTDGFVGMIPGYKVTATDSTAAGDVFNGALAAALAGGMQVQKAVEFAQKAAAISVTRMGAQPSAPFFYEIEKFNT